MSDDLEKIIVKEDSVSAANSEPEEDHFRTKIPFHERLNIFLHTQHCQIFIVILVIIDVLLVIAELLIDLRVVEVDHVGDEPSKSNTVAEVLHFLSLAILSFFMLEIIVKLYAMRLSFFKHKMEVFDAIIVIVAFALDVAYARQEGAINGINMLVILRLWRIARIINGT